MKNLLFVEMKIEKYQFERQLLNRRIEQFEGAGCNWKIVNRKMKIAMLKRLNKIERKIRFWKMTHKGLLKFLNS